MITNFNKHQPRKGAALLMVLLVVALLSSMVFAVLVAVNNSGTLDAAKVNDTDASILAQTGINIGSHPDVYRNDPLLSYESDDGTEKYTVEIVSEASKLDINRVLVQKDKPFLRNLFTSWGMDLDSAAQLVDGMVDWVDKDDNEELNGAEKIYYSSKGFSNRPYNKRFTNLKDLRLVRNFDQLEQVKPEWVEFFTIWSGEKLDLVEAKPDILAAALSVDRDTVLQFKQNVSGEDGVVGTKDDRQFSSLDEALDDLGVARDVELRKKLFSRVQLSSKTRRVVCEAEASGTKKSSMVVIRYSRNKVILIHSDDKIDN